MDLRKLTENGEQFLGRQKSSGSEGGDAQQWCWVPCWVRRFSYSLSSWNFPGSVDGFPPATVGQVIGTPTQPLRAVASHQCQGRGCPGGGHTCHPLDIHFPHCPLHSGARVLRPRRQLSERSALRPKHRMFLWETRWGGRRGQPHVEWNHREMQQL